MTMREHTQEVPGTPGPSGVIFINSNSTVNLQHMAMFPLGSCLKYFRFRNYMTRSVFLDAMELSKKQCYISQKEHHYRGRYAFPV